MKIDRILVPLGLVFLVSACGSVQNSGESLTTDALVPDATSESPALSGTDENRVTYSTEPAEKIDGLPIDPVEDVCRTADLSSRAGVAACLEHLLAIGEVTESASAEEMIAALVRLGATEPAARAVVESILTAPAERVDCRSGGGGTAVICECNGWLSPIFGCGLDAFVEFCDASGGEVVNEYRDFVTGVRQSATCVSNG